MLRFCAGKLPARGLSAWCALRQRRIEHLGRAVPRLREAEYLAEFRTDLEGFVALEVVEACVGDYREQQPAADNSYSRSPDVTRALGVRRRGLE
jgi:hypothetical protein